MSEYMPSIGGRISYKRPGLTKCPGLIKHKQRHLHKFFPNILERIFFFLWMFTCLALFVLLFFGGYFDKRPVRLIAYFKQVPTQKRVFKKTNQVA